MVAVADAAGLDRDPHLVGAHLGRWQVDEAQLASDRRICAGRTVAVIAGLLGMVG